MLHKAIVECWNDLDWEEKSRIIMNYIDDIKLTKNSLNQYVLMKKFFIINNSINSLHVYIKFLTCLY